MSRSEFLLLYPELGDHRNETDVKFVEHICGTNASKR